MAKINYNPPERLPIAKIHIFWPPFSIVNNSPNFTLKIISQRQTFEGIPISLKFWDIIILSLTKFLRTPRQIGRKPKLYLICPTHLRYRLLAEAAWLQGESPETPSLATSSNGSSIAGTLTTDTACLTSPPDSLATESEGPTRFGGSPE